MKKHPVSVEGFNSLEELAIAVGKMRYDKLAEFFLHLHGEMARQQAKDLQVGKVKLVEDAHWLIDGIYDCHLDAQELFHKYKKFMKDELDEN